MSDVQTRIEAIADVGHVWSQDTNSDAGLLATPELVFVGGVGIVTAYADRLGRSRLVRRDVEGEATALAAANGHLIVGTTSGHMYAFGSSRTTTSRLACSLLNVSSRLQIRIPTMT